MKKQLLLSTVCLTLLLGTVMAPTYAQAQQEMGSIAYYPVSEAEYSAHYHEWSVFLEYQLNREPCQNYQLPPAGYVMRDCTVYRVGQPAAVITQTQQVVQETQSIEAQRVIADKSPHTIYFDYNKSNIRPSEEHKIASVAQEIRDYDHEHVTVAGHTDSSGSAAYNMELSQRRVHVITEALIAQGIRKEVLNEVLDNKAYGEADQAVRTNDGVKMPENRRTVISFTN